MPSDSTCTMSQTICVDGESSPDTSEFCLLRSRNDSAYPEPSTYDQSVAIDVSARQVSAVSGGTIPSVGPCDPLEMPSSDPEESETALCKRLAQQLENESHSRRCEDEAELTRRFLEEEDEYLFRRFLAREERRACRVPFVPPCAQNCQWFRALSQTFSHWAPRHTEDMWRNHDVRRCDCLGGPQGFHRPDCIRRNTSANPQ